MTDAYGITSLFCWKLVVDGCIRNPHDCVVFLRAFGAVHTGKRISLTQMTEPLFNTLSDFTDFLRRRK